jgi:hypothetical protein
MLPPSSGLQGQVPSRARLRLYEGANPAFTTLATDPFWTVLSMSRLISVSQQRVNCNLLTKDFTGTCSNEFLSSLNTRATSHEQKITAATSRADNKASPFQKKKNSIQIMFSSSSLDRSKKRVLLDHNFRTIIRHHHSILHDHNPIKFHRRLEAMQHGHNRVRPKLLHDNPLHQLLRVHVDTETTSACIDFCKVRGEQKRRHTCSWPHRVSKL